MSEEFKLKFKGEIEGQRELDDFFEQGASGAERLQSKISNAFKGAGQTISAFASKASSEMQEFAGKELGGSIGSNARGILQLRDSITALAIAADKGTDIVGGLKDQIQATSVSSNQLQGDVTDALRAFVDQTGDLDTARKNIELYGKTATATGAAMKEVALIGVELADKLKITDQSKAFAILAEQSKGGAIHLRDLAKQGPRLFNVAVSAGVTGESGLREIGALAETYAKYVGGSGASKAARVSTAVENTFSSIAKKASRLEAAGIQVEGRDRFDVLFDIIRKTGGNETKLREIFSQQAMRAILGVANEYKKTGRFDTFEGLRNREVDPRILDKDFAARMGTGESKIKAQQISRQAFYDKYFGGIAEFGAAHASELQVGAIGLGFLGKGMSLLGGGVGGKLGGALSAAGASRVFVVNWPSGFGAPGTPGAGGGKIGPGGVVAALGVGAATYGIASAYMKTKEGEQMSSAIADVAQYALHGKKNLDSDRAKEIQGGWKLAMAGLWGGSKGMADAARQEVKNNIKIEIVDGKATVTEDDGTRSKVALERRKADGG